MSVSNAGVNDLIIRLAAPEPDQRILELGFGSGALVAKAATAVPEGSVSGVDVPEEMFAQACRRNAAAVREVRVELRKGDVSGPPCEEGSFDRVLSVHSTYFWPDPVRDFVETLRLLKPGGLLVVPVDPREPTELSGDGDLLLSLLKRSGFERARVEPATGRTSSAPWAVSPAGTRPD